MATLRIEHSISDFPTWKGAFDRFAPIRKRAGVRRFRIFQPMDDPAYVLLDLDFDEVTEARAFLAILERDIWGSSDASPALAGRPQACIIEAVEFGDVSS
jgi:hypothetical protein